MCPCWKVINDRMLGSARAILIGKGNGKSRPGTAESKPRSHLRFLTPNRERIILSLVLVAAIVGISAWFSHPAYLLTPMGDAYIHFQYAHNLAEYGELTYNLGMEEGIGSTSVLWILILAGFVKVGIPALITSKVLGVVLLAVCGVLLYDLMRSLLPLGDTRQGALLAGSVSLLTCLSGNFVWIALSGMETLLFLALGLWVLWLYWRRRMLWCGVALGLLTLARVEGVALAGVVMMVELLRNRRIDANLWKLLVPFLLLTLPWMGYLYTREGLLAPGSFQGKQISYDQTMRMLDERNPAMAMFTHVTPVVFLSAWVGYVLLFMSGGAGLPGPSLDLPGVWDGTFISVPVLSLVIFLLVTLPAGVILWRFLWRNVWRQDLKDQRTTLLVVVVVWTLGHNLAYALFMPQPGSAGRYALMNHIFFWASLVALAVWARGRGVKLLVGVTVLLLFTNSLYYWQEIYHLNVAYLEEVRLPAARYVDQNCPADTPVGSTDLGPLRDQIQQPVLDLIGYVNKEIVSVVRSGGSIEDYILDKGVTCLYMFMPVGRVGVDTVQVMGLASDSRFNLVLERTYAVTTDDWLAGSSPVSNYMPAIAIYRIERLE